MERHPKIRAVLPLLAFCLLAGGCGRSPRPVEEKRIVPNEPVPFAVNQVVEEPLAPGETRTLLVALAAGDFVQIEVDQLGIDVTVRLLAPNGLPLASVDSPYGDRGTESLAALAAAPG